MQEVYKLLLLLAIIAVCNILGGVYINVNMNNIKFDYKELIKGIIKAICVGAMFVGIAYVIESVPSLGESLGVEPKAMIVSAIAIYSSKVIGHLSTIFGLKKEIDQNKVATKVEEVADELFVDM